MNKFLLNLAGAIGALLMISACATGPDVVASESAPADVSGPAPGSQEDLEQSAGHRVFFAYNAYTLTPQAQSTLARQAEWLKKYPATRILVAGNCDERGTREYNLALGARRAEAARAYLTSLGVDGSRIETVSYGKESPIDPRSTEEAWAVNRNATTTLRAVGL